jgi:hypothetical protein
VLLFHAEKRNTDVKRSSLLHHHSIFSLSLRVGTVLFTSAFVRVCANLPCLASWRAEWSPTKANSSWRLYLPRQQCPVNPAHSSPINSIRPHDLFWVMLHLVDTVAQRALVTLKQLQGGLLLVSQQRAHLRRFQADVKESGLAMTATTKLWRLD